MNIQTPITSDENVLFKSFNFMIFVCTNNHQWIIQKRYGKSISEQGWRPISYYRPKESLVRVYNEKTGDTLGANVLDKMLPSYFGGDS